MSGVLQSGQSQSQKQEPHPLDLVRQQIASRWLLDRAMQGYQGPAQWFQNRGQLPTSRGPGAISVAEYGTLDPSGADAALLNLVNFYNQAGQATIRQPGPHPNVQLDTLKQIFPWMLNQLQIPATPGTAGVGVPQRPVALGRGGMVMQPTHALLGERGPEAVLPLPDMIRMMGMLMASRAGPMRGKRTPMPMGGKSRGAMGAMG